MRIDIAAQCNLQTEPCCNHKTFHPITLQHLIARDEAFAATFLQKETISIPEALIGDSIEDAIEGRGGMSKEDTESIGF